MSRLALVPLLLAALVMAQQGPVKKTPEVIKAEIETDVIRARLDLAASQRRLAALTQTLEIRKLEAEAALRAARAEAAAAPVDAEQAKLKLDAGLYGLARGPGKPTTCAATSSTSARTGRSASASPGTCR